MKVIDLPKELQGSYFCCLEDWSDEMKEAGDLKEKWYENYIKKGLRVKIALDDKGVQAGMIQYLPIEESFADGKDLYFILCIWVHGYDEGQGNFQDKGYGMALLKAAEEDAKERGAKGMAAWGLSIPAFMRASWFKKHGYVKADKNSVQVLLWKPFLENATPPRWVRQKKKPKTVVGKVKVTSFHNGWCPGQNLVHERAKKAVLEFGDKILFEAIDTSKREAFIEWGITDALYIDNKNVRTGPPPSLEKIKKKIEKKVKKIK